MEKLEINLENAWLESLIRELIDGENHGIIAIKKRLKEEVENNKMVYLFDDYLNPLDFLEKFQVIHSALRWRKGKKVNTMLSHEDKVVGGIFVSYKDKEYRFTNGDELFELGLFRITEKRKSIRSTYAHSDTVVNELNGINAMIFRELKRVLSESK